MCSPRLTPWFRRHGPQKTIYRLGQDDRDPKEQQFSANLIQEILTKYHVFHDQSKGPELQQACTDGDVVKVKEMIIALERSPDWSQTINHQDVSNGPRPVSVTEAALTLSLTGLRGVHAAALGHQEVNRQDKTRQEGPSSLGGPTTGTRS